VNGCTAVKICGLRTAADARAATDAGASMVGLVFVTGSPRCINRDEADDIVRALPSDVEPVALLADPDDDDQVLAWWRGRVQLHGNESEETCQRIASRGFAVMKGFAYTPEALQRWNACNAIDMLVVDGPRGGGGVAFDHAALAAQMPGLSKRVLLAGGLTPHNVHAAITAVHPWGVDVSSGVELQRGVKDAQLIANFCRAAGITPRRVPPIE
jgi:phosphoribosylanthranilate isomerase